MKHNTKEYSELLNGRLPTSDLEFELCDRLIELQDKVKNNSSLHDVSNSNDGYQLIPMNEIEDEAREIAVRWHENATNWIGDKHKLASDIMSYAKKQVRKVCGG